MTADEIVATTDMVAHCFQVLIDHLRGSPVVNNHLQLPPATVGGMFVTWETNAGHLRGCIGCLSEIELHRLSDYAIRSSQNDTRFSPIRETELASLVCHVSILHSFQSCMHFSDWTVGVHGIIVELRDGGKRFSATFLPNVMFEQGWDQRQAVVEALKKSGFNGTVVKVLESVSVTRYQSSKASLTHAEYAQNIESD